MAVTEATSDKHEVLNLLGVCIFEGVHGLLVGLVLLLQHLVPRLTRGLHQSLATQMFIHREIRRLRPFEAPGPRPFAVRLF